MAKLKSAAEISKMRAAGQLTARALQHIEPYVRSGTSTEELNTLAHEFIVSNGAIPTPLGYMGYPKSVCTSINEVICHGIPSPQVFLKDGDIINIDISKAFSPYF